MLFLAWKFSDLLDARTGVSNIGRALWQRPTPLLSFLLLFRLLMWFVEFAMCFNVMHAFLHASRCHVLNHVIFRRGFPFSVFKMVCLGVGRWVRQRLTLYAGLLSVLRSCVLALL